MIKKQKVIKFEFNDLETDGKEIFNQDDFAFTKITPDSDKMLEVAGKYGDIKNLIIIGRGGSVSTFRAFWHGYGKYISDKEVYFVDTVDPDYTFYVKDKCLPENSLVVSISKSGTTVDVLENVLTFDEFKHVVITSESDNPLRKISEEKGYETITHPEVGGRFSGVTEVGLFPALLCGLDISEVRKGAKQAYEDFQKDGNDALKLALAVDKLNRKGYDEIFWPIYSRKMIAFYELIQQLVNESAAKDGKGISLIITEGPECHHYLNQRFFGGPKNMIGFFTSVGEFQEDKKITVPETLKQVKLRDANMGVLEGLNLSASMKFELKSAYEDAKNNKIPSVKLEIDKVDEFNLGYFTAFIQIFSIYLARAFGVNPFDQPEVEGAKKISFEARKNYKK